jgi:hypothetical protein
MSIHEGTSKIKSFLDSPTGHNLLVILIILGVSVAGFSLGTMSSKKDGAKVIVSADGNLANLAAAAQTAQISAQKGPGGQSAAEGGTKSPIKEPINDPATSPVQNEKGAFVASKKGKKYYPVNCAGAKSLAEANRIYFQTAGEAEAKGYSLSTSCK